MLKFFDEFKASSCLLWLFALHVYVHACQKDALKAKDAAEERDREALETPKHIIKKQYNQVASKPMVLTSPESAKKEGECFC